MQNGSIGISSENLFPIIKKFLYADHDIFLREIVSNAVDATQKLKTLSQRGEFNGTVENLAVKVTIDKAQKTLTVSDNGIGMTQSEVERYINQIAFSSANEFMEQYKGNENAIIGHFGLGFYSSFMVSKQVDIITQSHKPNESAVKWSCNGSPEYSIEPAQRSQHGTDIIMHLNDDSEEFLEKERIAELLNKYCKFLPVPILFGKKTEWKDGESVDTEEDNQINNPAPLWTKKPADIKPEAYNEFYHELYPMSDEPLFHIHLNVDYPFNLTGILYFPKLQRALEMQRNKIHLYCNQVFVSDAVEGIVPEYLLLLHGVIDSPDIPLNVSRSYLQGDPNVKKISAHISKKVSDRLQQLFNDDRESFEKNWDNLKTFVEYGMLTDEKFAERALKFFLLKSVDDKYYTFEEYETLIQANQTDNKGKLTFIYANNKQGQHQAIQAAQNKGYDVLLMDETLAIPFIQHLEQKQTNKTFVRVDSSTADKLVAQEANSENSEAFNAPAYKNLVALLQAACPNSPKQNFMVELEALNPNELPIVITQNEFGRRMKEASQFQTGMHFYDQLPDQFKLIANTNNSLIKKALEEVVEKITPQLNSTNLQIEALKAEKKTATEQLKAAQASKNAADEQTIQANLKVTQASLAELEQGKHNLLQSTIQDQVLIQQLVDLALLSGNLLKGAALSSFIQRSIALINR